MKHRNYGKSVVEYDERFHHSNKLIQQSSFSALKSPAAASHSLSKKRDSQVVAERAAKLIAKIQRRYDPLSIGTKTRDDIRVSKKCKQWKPTEVTLFRQKS